MTKKKQLNYDVKELHVVALEMARSTKAAAVKAFNKALKSQSGDYTRKTNQFIAAKEALKFAIEAEALAFELQRKTNIAYNKETRQLEHVKVSEVVRHMRYDDLVDVVKLAKESIATAWKFEKENRKSKKEKVA